MVALMFLCLNLVTSLFLPLPGGPGPDLALTDSFGMSALTVAIWGIADSICSP
jgi:hypothetical protein